MNTTHQPIIIAGVCWSSALAGALIGLILFTALSALGMTVAGAALTFDSLSEVGWGSLIWMILCLAASGYVTGLIAGSGSPGLTTKSAATLSGITAGCVLVLVLTMVSYNLLASAVRATATVAGATASAVGSAASAAGSVAQAGATQLSQMSGQNFNIEGALREVGLAEEYNAITAGQFDREDFARVLADASPELNQVQTSAAVDAVIGVLENARQNITQNIGSIQDVRELPQTVRSEWQQVTNELTGQQFVSRLQDEGLTAPQAQQVSTVVAERITQMQGEAEQALGSLQRALDDVQNRVAATANQAVETTGDVVSTGALSWLIFAIILVGLAGLGGYQSNDEDQILEDARQRTAARNRAHIEPTWSDERPLRAGNT